MEHGLAHLLWIKETSPHCVATSPILNLERPGLMLCVVLHAVIDVQSQDSIQEPISMRAQYVVDHFASSSRNVKADPVLQSRECVVGEKQSYAASTRHQTYGVSRKQTRR